MRKKIPASYFVILVLLLVLLSMSKELTDGIRGTAVAVASPSWQQLAGIKAWWANKASKGARSTSSEELQRLQIENQLLRNQLVQLKESMQREWHLLAQLSASPENEGLHTANTLLKKSHQLQLKKAVEQQLQATPAKIIFRSLASWNSSFWIDLGANSNASYGKQIIAKNSPVLVGTSIIGVVDYLGKNQSRVRLITDSGLTPSVRVKREKMDFSLLKEKILLLLQYLGKDSDRAHSFAGQAELVENLRSTLSQLPQEDACLYLAKGELQGMSKPLWRACRHHLHGHGFNYDYADAEGPARDLRSGQVVGGDTAMDAVPILKPGDLLVTTGMDGVFPPDFLVAQVLSVAPLKEGDYFYDLEACPTAGNLDDLTVVFVLPPSGYTSE